MPQASTEPQRRSPSSLVGEIVGGRFALVDEIGPDGLTFRYLAFDTVERRELELRVIPRSNPEEPYWFEVVTPTPTAPANEASTPPMPSPLNRVQDTILPKASPDPIPAGPATPPPANRPQDPAPRPAAPPREFGPLESDWFEQGETLEQQPPLEWLETDVDSPPRAVRHEPSTRQDTPELSYSFSWASALIDD